MVTTVEIDARARRAGNNENTSVSDLQFGSGISWTQTDRALPMAVDMNDPVMALTVNSSDFQEAMNREMLKVAGLNVGKYTLRIDGEEVATFVAEDLAQGAGDVLIGEACGLFV